MIFQSDEFVPVTQITQVSKSSENGALMGCCFTPFRQLQQQPPQQRHQQQQQQQQHTPKNFCQREKKFWEKFFLPKLG